MYYALNYKSHVRLACDRAGEIYVVSGELVMDKVVLLALLALIRESIIIILLKMITFKYSKQTLPTVKG